MLIKAIKITKIKIWVVVAAIVVIAGAIFLALPPAYAQTGVSGVTYKNIKTNEDRINFLKSFGWEVEIQPSEVIETQIPKDFSPVYEKYNEIQKLQGLNLEKYREKTVKRWTYIVTNYPDAEGEVQANVIIYKDSVIAGDICSIAAGGFVHGFKK